MIVCGGEALMDMVPDGERPDSFRARPGGCPYNTAIAAARLGANVSFLGRLGKDFLGERLFDRLAENGVDTSLVLRCDNSTTLAFVTKGREGGARYAFYAEGAADRGLAEADLPAALPAKARFLMVGSISMVQEPIASTVEKLIDRERGKLIVSFDPNIRPSLIPDRSAYLRRFERWASMSTIVKISSEDIEWLFPGSSPEGAVDRLRSLGPELVVATLGEAGVFAVNAGSTVRAAGFRVSVVDTIGAGDTFHGALLARLDEQGVATRAQAASLGGARLEECLRYANAAAAINCMREGADPPSGSEVSTFLGRRRGKPAGSEGS
jgi:fructokinase